MAVPTVFRQVRGDMEIRTSNGVLLGRVVDVLWGTDVSGQRHSLAQLVISAELRRSKTPFEVRISISPRTCLKTVGTAILIPSFARSRVR